MRALDAGFLRILSCRLWNILCLPLSYLQHQLRFTPKGSYNMPQLLLGQRGTLFSVAHVLTSNVKSAKQLFRGLLGRLSRTLMQFYSPSNVFILQMHCETLRSASPGMCRYSHAALSSTKFYCIFYMRFSSYEHTVFGICSEIQIFGYITTSSRFC